MPWAYVPQCSACAPATEDSNWGSEKLASILASSVTWRGKPSPPQTWSRRFKRRPWIRLLSGLTCGHSTHGPLQGSICSSQASRVSRGVRPGSVRVSTTSDGSGQTSLALSVSADPAPSSSNAPPASAKKGSPSCSPTLPIRGTMLRGHVTSLPPRQEHPTVGPGSSWSRGRWPTPAASDSRSSGRHTTTTGVMHPGTSLTDAMRQWPTPCARDHQGGNLKPYSERGGGTKGEQLPNFVRHHFHQVQTTPKAGEPTSQPAVLNPAFLEALMGLPIGWTGFASRATE